MINQIPFGFQTPYLNGIAWSIKDWLYTSEMSDRWLRRAHKNEPAY